jgi:hypothetical protein
VDFAKVSERHNTRLGDSAAIGLGRLNQSTRETSTRTHNKILDKPSSLLLAQLKHARVARKVQTTHCLVEWLVRPIPNAHRVQILTSAPVGILAVYLLGVQSVPLTGRSQRIFRAFMKHMRRCALAHGTLREMPRRV